MDHSQCYTRYFEVITVVRKSIGWRRWRDLPAEPHLRCDGHVLGDAQIALVQQEGRARRLDDGSGGHDVVEVGVTRHDAGDAHTHVASQGKDLVGLVAWIDHAG